MSLMVKRILEIMLIPTVLNNIHTKSINGQKPMVVLYSSANVCSSFVNSRGYLQKMFSAYLKLCAGKTVKSLETHTFSS